jgi:hypothetical protein
VPLLLVAGFAVLLAAWALLFWTESMFTESHLVGYYCCAAETDLPAPGTLERTLSDFFRALPGKHLPSLLFVGGNVALFAWTLRRERRPVWWLPWLFILFTIIYVLVDLELLVVSWSISNRIVGPRTSPYAGYGRTWYGIALHLALWAVHFVTLAGLLRRPLPRTQSNQKVAKPPPA